MEQRPEIRYRRVSVGRALRIRRSETIASLIQEELEGMIVSGELAGGDRLNETALSEQFQVSRGPVREACRGLERTGLIRIVPNRGVFVREMNVKEALELYEIRAALFGLAGKLLAARITNAEVKKLSALIDEMDAAVDASDINAFYPPNVEFHALLVRYSGNGHLVSLIPTLDKQLHLFRRRGLVRPGKMRSSNQEHKEILSAVAAHDGGRAGALMEQHILAGKGRLLATLKEKSVATPLPMPPPASERWGRSNPTEEEDVDEPDHRQNR